MKAAELRPMRCRRCVFCLPLLFLLGRYASADVELTGAVAVGATHTDNVSLVNEDPQSELVYQLFPRFNLTQESTRTRTDVSYAVEAYRYDDLGESDVYQTYNAAFQLALDPDNFFFDIGADRYQTVRDPEAVIARSNLPLVTNRIDRDNYYAGPTFQYFAGSEMTVHGSYRRDWVRYEDDSSEFLVPEYEIDSFEFALDNYRRERGFAWAVRYSAQETDYHLTIPWEYRRAGVEAGGWVATGYRVFVSAGRESPWDDPFDPSLSDDYWEVGFARTVGADFTAEVAVGERSFGDSKRVLLSWTFGRGSAELRYVEEPTSLGHDPFQNFGIPTIPTDDLGDFLTRPGSAEVYLSNRLLGNFAIDLRRASLSLSIADEDREDRIRLDGTPLNDESQLAVYLTGALQVGSRTELFVRGEDIRREFLDDREDRLRSLSIGAEYRLGRRTAVSMTLARTSEESDNVNADRDYTEDLVTLLLSRTFE